MTFSLPFLVCAAITAVSAFISLGFSIRAVVVSAGDTRQTAMYATARSFALAAVAVVPFLGGSRSWLLAVATAMTIVQAIDAWIGWRAHDPLETYGPAGTAIANLAAIVWLLLS